MKTEEKTLEKLGFSERETSLYLFLLEHGASSISKISRGLALHRPIVYKAIQALEEKGVLILSPKGAGKLYTAASPTTLKEIINKVSNELDSILPQLEHRYVERAQKPDVTFLEGRKAVTHAFMDVVRSLKRGEMFYRYTSEKDLDKVNSYLPPEYRKIRDEKKLERLVISNPVSGSQKKPRLERFIKYIPPELDSFQQNVIQLVYGNKVAFIDLNSETSLIIENEALAEFQKVIFKALYKKLDS